MEVKALCRNILDDWFGCYFNWKWFTATLMVSWIYECQIP